MFLLKVVPEKKLSDRKHAVRWKLGAKLDNNTVPYGTYIPTYFRQLKKLFFMLGPDSGAGSVALSRLRLQLGQKGAAPAPQP